MSRPTGYRNYTSDGRYWTVRKLKAVYWVVLIDPSEGSYKWSDIWGGYTSAGAAGGAAAQLGYGQGNRDAIARLRDSLHIALDDVGLGVPSPTPAPIGSTSAPQTSAEQSDDLEDP